MFSTNTKTKDGKKRQQTNGKEGKLKTIIISQRVKKKTKIN